MSEYSFPPLTTVHQPVYQIGGMVCEMLIKVIQDEIAEKQQVLLQPKLVIRQSCGLNN
jgi:DNA-binding LacI/PurR family transcriptional regulator